MKLSMDIKPAELTKFDARCAVAVSSVDKGTKAATTRACQDILDASLQQVPKDTWTMMSSGYFEVKRRTSHSFQGVVGYGGNGDPVNPKTGKRASQYMVDLHENLDTYHANGKAKFLEDPAREYMENKLYRTIFDYASEALASMSG